MRGQNFKTERNVKNLSVVLNVVLVVAVLVLYVLHFSSKQSISEQLSETNEAIEGGISNLSIAYINSDTLVSNYDFFKDKLKELEQKRDRMEQEYGNRARGLQDEISRFQRDAQNMTMAQARAKEEELMRKQQNLMQYQESLGQQLMADEGRITNELYDNVADFLKEYGKANNLQMVMTYSKGSGVIYANDSLDITTVVVSELNKRYKEPSADSKKEEKKD